jgi:hypothetical protein
MFKGNLKIVRDNTVLRILPGSEITVKQNGTLWYKGNPILGITDPQEKVKASKAAKEKQWRNIPDESYVRLGNNKNGIWAGDEDLWNNSEIKLIVEKKIKDKLAEDKKIVTLILL